MERRSRVRWTDESGATLVEYAFMLALIAVICVALVQFFGLAVRSLFDLAVAAIENVL